MSHKSRRRRPSTASRPSLSSSTRLLAERLEDRVLLTTVSGTLNGNIVWDPAGSPYDVTDAITIPPTATLEVEPGVVVRFQDNTGMHVEGRLIADGSASLPITFEPASAASPWNGLTFQNTLADNRIGYAEIRGGDAQGQAIDVDHARLTLDNVTWLGTQGTILALDHPSVVVRNSHFPASVNGPVVDGRMIEDNEYLILEGNVFDDSHNDQEVVTFTGAERPGPVLQVLNNAFLGGGNAGLALAGGDAHIEGNLFVGFHADAASGGTAHAITAGRSPADATHRTELTIVRNLFFDSDHAVQIVEESFATLEHNLFSGFTEAVFQFNEVGGTTSDAPGLGATFDGNIFSNNSLLFENLVDDGVFQTILSVNRSILPNQLVDFDGVAINAHDLGIDNRDVDPMFVDAAAGNYRLQHDSPAIGTGPDGLDIGAYVPAGPTVTGVPTTVSNGDDLVFQVGGPGITHYRYRVNEGSYGPITPVGTLLQLTDLPTGNYTLDVIGQNDAGEWFAGQTPAFYEHNAEVIAPAQTRTGEILPIVVRVRDSHHQIHSLFTAAANLDNATELASTQFEIAKGVGSLSPIVNSGADFSLQLTDGLAQSPARDIQVLDASFPVLFYGGELTGDIVWDNTAERQITSDLSIPSGSSLTIEPGTRVMLGDRVNIDVAGTITASGTALNPIVFNSLNPTEPWGGIELGNTATGTFDYSFFTNAAADSSRTFGHSNSQPVVHVDGGQLNFTNSFILNAIGKAFGSDAAELNIDQSVISHVDTGGQFDDSLVTITHTYVMNIPNGDRQFDDDDNDGLYFHGYHGSGAPSLFQDSLILNTKDDGIDHNGARLEVVRAWIEGAAHEGIATSNSNYLRIVDSVVTRSNQGIEAGYGAPDVTIRNTVLFNNDSQTDPNSQITAGLRFGDGYDGGNGAYRGHVTAVDNVIHDNGDNVRNYDGSIPGPQPGAIDITYSMTNDQDYDDQLGNSAGLPLFGPFMHLLRGSDGHGTGRTGEDVGRLLPPDRNTFRVVRADSTPPTAPGTVQGQTTGITQVTLTWTPALDPESGIEAYNIYRDGQWIDTVSSTTFVDDQIVQGATYLYAVTAVNAAGSEGAAAHLPLTVSVSWVFQDGVFPDPSYFGTRDAWIRGGGDANTPLGQDDRLDADGDSSGNAEWSLLRWDASPIASGIDIQNVTLTLTVNNSSPDEYLVYALNRDWVESQVTYAQWATGQDWELPGTGPSDRGLLVGALATQGQTGNQDVILNSDGVELVQSWVNDPTTNYGVILYSPSSNDGVEIRAREYAVAQQRPKLTILLGNSQPGLPGDYNRNGSVDQPDYDFWKATYGSTAALHADGNADGIVNTADFTVWRENLGSTSELRASAVPTSAVTAPQATRRLTAPRTSQPESLAGYLQNRDRRSFATVRQQDATVRQQDSTVWQQDWAREHRRVRDHVFEQWRMGPLNDNFQWNLA